MNTVLEGLLIGIGTSVFVVVLPLAYKLKGVIDKHKTLSGKVKAVIAYMKAHPTTDNQLESLIEDVAKAIEMVK
jgi:hypothetical protein